MISNLTLTTRTKNRSKRIFLKKKIKKIAAIRNELMMNSNKMNTQNFGEIPDITEDQAKAILTTKMDAKIIDVYQFPYAVSEIIEAMNSIEENFSTEKFLSMKEVTKCPPRIMNCIKHCIKEIFPKTIVDPHKNQCLNQFFRLKNKWCTNEPSTVVNAINTLTLRLNTGKSKSVGDDTESLEWYCNIIERRTIPITTLYQYEKTSVDTVFLLGLLPNDETFYQIGAREMVSRVQELESDGRLKLRKNVEQEKAMNAEGNVSDDEEEKGLFVKNKKWKFKETKPPRKGEYVLTKYCFCCICHKQGHIARYCRQRQNYPKDTRNIYHTTFYEKDPSDPLSDYTSSNCKDVMLWTRSMPTDRMVLDSGVTQHLFRSSTKLYNKKQAELKIHTVNGITISHEKGDYDDRILKLKNVYVVPSSAENLISIN